MKCAEKKYYTDRINENKDNMKKTWGIIKEAIGPSCASAKTNLKFKEGDSVVEDVPTIVDKFNETFVNLGPNLARNIDVDGTPSPTSYIEDRNANSIFVSPVSVEEVRNIILSLKNSSAPGWDQIKPAILKRVADVISFPLALLLNNCISEGIFPNELKIARVTPIYKGGDNTIFKNYRPVSVLSSFSKIFEKLLYNRLTTFFDDHNALTEFQFGFRKKRSTCEALLHFVNEATKALDISINDTVIETVHVTKFLGVFVQSNLK